MGQFASSSSAEDSTGHAEPAPKTCYYELLSVERTAGQDDIKKAYRKKALELHPDRNYNDVERATRLFAEVQTAYEVLSDPQERAWYDSHRDAILQGTHNPDNPDNPAAPNVTTSGDVLSWFSQFSMHTSFDDGDERGFYATLRRAFDKLASEEIAAAEWEVENPTHYPGFGGASSTYEGSVRKFYLVWMNFSTQKSFSWCDLYRYSDAPDRRVKRAMEKENMKAREAARKEFNDTVISFVRFVRKRDPRFTPKIQTEAQRQAALLKLSREQATRQRAENAKRRGEYKAAAWTKGAEEASEEDELGGEAGDRGSGEEEEVVVAERWECIVCKKVFWSAGQMDAHEKSKKHVKAVQQLKRKMVKENKKFDLDRDVRGREKPHDDEFESTPMDDDNDAVTEDILDDMLANGGADAEHIPATTADELEAEGKALEPEKPPVLAEPELATEYDSDEYVSREEFSARVLGEDEDEISSGLASAALTDHEDSKLAAKIGKAKAKRVKRAQKVAATEGEQAQTTDFNCSTCQECFPSKTRLFNHLKENPKHARLVPVSGGGGGGSGKKKKGKR